MLHKAHFITVDPVTLEEHQKDDVEAGKEYEVLAVDHESSLLYIYNDKHVMLPINEYHCIEVEKRAEYTGEEQ